MGPNSLPTKGRLPSGIWLCPAHYEEFHVPHGGVCPEAGCQERLVAYSRIVAVPQKLHGLPDPDTLLGEDDE